MIILSEAIEFLHDPKYLNQQIFFIPFPGRLHLVIDIPGGLEDNLLQPEFYPQFFQE